ncbi:hypothetical protein MNB_SV-15-600 [hydrothermal vent metagenome]|uniref:HEPN domain-containing protein n=1 Tax=hydrothermal vent metagenome TaxID=652676 RepID=A0A1W1EJR4_9ZZZZ
MVNKTYALEWLNFSIKNLNTAKLLFEANHYEDEIVFLREATNYYKEDRYPNPNYFLPSKEEIKEILDFTDKLFYRVCQILEMDISEVKC